MAPEAKGVTDVATDVGFRLSNLRRLIELEVLLGEPGSMFSEAERHRRENMLRCAFNDSRRSWYESFFISGAPRTGLNISVEKRAAPPS